MGAAYALCELLKWLAVSRLAVFSEFMQVNHFVGHGHQQGLKMAVEMRGDGNQGRVGQVAIAGERFVFGKLKDDVVRRRKP